MTKATVDTKDDVRHPGAVPLSSTPSRVEEGEPTFARTAGFIGACLPLLGILIWLWNRYTPESYIRFNPFVVPLCWVLGLAGLLLHAFRDRDLMARRSYGLLGYTLLAFGALWTTLAVGTPWFGLASALAVAAGVGVVLVAFTAAPFVREMVPEADVSAEAARQTTKWAMILAGVLILGLYAVIRLYVQEQAPWEDWRALLVDGLLIGGLLAVACGGIYLRGDHVARWWYGLQTNSRIQQITMALILTVAIVLLTGYFLRRMPILPYGLGGLILGLLFLLAYTTNEDEAGWRDAAVYVVGVVAALAALVAAGSSVTDLIGLHDIVIPHGLTFGFLVGLPFLGAFIGMKGSDSDLGYRASRLVGYAGLILLAVAAVRSLVPILAHELWGAYAVPSYLVPNGLLLMALGGTYAALGWTLASDNKLLVMTRRELGAYFYSLVAYIVIAGMAFVAWVSYLLFIKRISDASREGIDLPEPIIAGYFFALFPVICLIFAVPVVTMRLLSEEQRTGTIEVLMTAPVSEATVVLSKFFAALIFFMVAWGVWAVYPLALRIIGEESFDYRPLMSFYVGLACMSAGFLAMGLFFSSLTRNQIIAALLTFAGMIILTMPYFILWFLQEQTWVEVLRYVSYLHHLEELVEGKVHLRYLLFHVSAAVFWLFLTVKVMEARKWR